MDGKLLTIPMLFPMAIAFCLSIWQQVALPECGKEINLSTKEITQWIPSNPIKQVISEYAKLRPSHGNIHLEPIFDDVNSRYVLMEFG